MTTSAVMNRSSVAMANESRSRTFSGGSEVGAGGGDSSSDVPFKCAWRGRGRLGSLNHPVHSDDVVATDDHCKVSLVGFRSGSSSSDKKNGGGGGGEAVSQRASAVSAAMSSGGGGGIQTISTGALLHHHQSHPGEVRQRDSTTKWYVEPPQQAMTFSPKSMEKTELSSLPVITPSGLQQTMLAALDHSDLLTGLRVSSDSAASQPQPLSPEKKLNRTQPPGTIEYRVKKNDTLERIAAHFDVTPSELKKLNRMSSRMVFENQVLYIPDPDYVPSDPPTPEPVTVSPPLSPVDTRPKIDVPLVRMADKPPSRVPGHAMKIPSPPPAPSPLDGDGNSSLPHPLSEEEAKQLDDECYERFIKLSAKYITEGLDKIAGTLLVTPNAIMFDPDVLDDRVVDNGPDDYGVVVYMDTIVSAALYHDLSAMRYHNRSNIDAKQHLQNAAGLEYAIETCYFVHKQLYSSQKELSEKPEVFHGDTRARSASTSSILTKPPSLTTGDATQGFTTSKSISGLSPIAASAEEDIRSTSGLSPFFKEKEAATEQSKAVKPTADKAEDKPDSIKVVGEVSRVSLNQIINLGPEVGETSTEAAAGRTTPLVIFDACSPSSEDAPEVTMGGKDSILAKPPAQDEKAKGDESHTSEEAGECDSDDEGKIAALLAGGRRDSVNFGATGESSSGIFYPTSLLPETKAEEEVTTSVESAHRKEDPQLSSNDELVQKCADKLVADILNSVIQGKNTEADDQSAEGEGGVLQTQKEEKGKMGEEEKKEAKDSVEGEGVNAQIITQEGGKGAGDELKIGNIVYLPVEEGDDGHFTIRDSHNILGADHHHPGPSPTSTDTTSTSKHKPPPLSDLGGTASDTTDGSSPAPTTGEGSGGRMRTASGSFSPLRSSAQHLSNFVSYATGFFRGSNEDRASVRDIQDMDGSQAETDGSSKRKGDLKGSESQKRFGGETKVTNAVTAEERPELFRQVSDIISYPEDVHNQPALYLHLHVDEIECDRRVLISAPCESYRHQSTKPRYWFSIPRSKADHLYAFFIQWRPDLYGDDEFSAEDRGFVVVDRVDLTHPTGSLPFIDDYFGQLGAAFRKDWEIISREEAKRRESVSVDVDNSMPEMSQESSILSQQHIKELSSHLPARTVGYKWSLVYSTNLHGFSLKRLYREVGHVDSPILLVLKDTDNTVFGSFLSDPPKLSDHFYGTGQCQLWTFKDRFRLFGWTGENAFFIKGDELSMSVGASQGVYGLWLDGDLYHGRSRQCTTFNNIVLSAHEDFCISGLEAWAFLND